MNADWRPTTRGPSGHEPQDLPSCWRFTAETRAQCRAGSLRGPMYRDFVAIGTRACSAEASRAERAQSTLGLVTCAALHPPPPPLRGVGEFPPRHHVDPPRMHRLEFDRHDRRSRRLRIDDPGHEEMLLLVARTHGRPLGVQQLPGIQRSGAEFRHDGSSDFSAQRVERGTDTAGAAGDESRLLHDHILWLAGGPFSRQYASKPYSRSRVVARGSSSSGRPGGFSRCPATFGARGVRK